jgi:hypothetical protein
MRTYQEHRFAMAIIPYLTETAGQAIPFLNPESQGQIPGTEDCHATS